MNMSLPGNEKIVSQRSWVGRDMADRQEAWLVELSGEDIEDLEQAADHFLGLGLDVGEISAGTFPLKHFDNYLKQLSETLVNGIGFEVVRGLPVSQYSREKSAAIFCGIGAHLGSARSQNAMGHILGHVRDIGADGKDNNTRIYQTSLRQTFHTDSADVVGLLCLKDAKSGGESLLVSAESIFNQIVEQRPDLVGYLFDPIATDRRGEIPDGELPYMQIPPFNWHQGLLTVFYQRQYIDSAQRFDGVLKLTSQHVEALDLFDRLADDPDLHLQMRLEPGDMQFVYNHAFLHDRSGFVDWEEPDERRHLLRLWLSMPGDRELPDCFRERYGSIEIGNRGGIITSQTKLHAPLD